MKKISISIIAVAILAGFMLLSCSPKVVQKQQWTEETIRKYLDDNKDKLEPIEGIYSLSSDKEFKIFGLTTPSKKSNDFGRVAILKNTDSLTPEFIEYWLDGLDVRKYAKTGEFTRIQKSSSYLGKKMMPGADPVTYTFARDDAAGTMEGVVEKSTSHSKLLYMKLYPEK